MTPKRIMSRLLYYESTQGRDGLASIHIAIPLSEKELQKLTQLSHSDALKELVDKFLVDTLYSGLIADDTLPEPTEP